MRISFDLDDTLINGRINFPVEKQNVFQKLAGFEKIRTGTITLMKQLQAKGYEIYIYTTSYRSEWKIWLNFLSYGILLTGIINGTKHRNEMKKRDFFCSKYPPMFGIDWHIDDSPGVEQEGLIYNFNTIIVDSRTDWSDFILQTINKKK